MNNKDRDHISGLLSTCIDLENFKEKLFLYDPKIETEYLSYEWVQGRDSEVNEIFLEMMVKKYGCDWALCKASRADGKPFMKKARKQIYGDDYDYIFSK